MTKIVDAVAQPKSQMIALSKLRLSPENVRKDYSKASIKQLAASIAAKGLLQNLAVIKKGDRFEVAAGGRRYRALKLLVEQKLISKDHKVSCQLRSEDEATEISLTENFQREQMHPADEIEAFGKLDREGHQPEEIAARFGISHMTVRRRLKLANVSPRILQLFRDGEASLEQLQALALTDDHGAQEAAFIGVNQWQRSAHHLRETLSGEAVPSSHRLAKFVTAKAYQAAGGMIIRDLFTADDSGYFKDRVLLTDLALAKLAKETAAFEGQGWSYVEGVVEFNEYQRRLRPALKVSKKDQKRLDKLQLLIEALDFDGDDQAHESQGTYENEIAEIEARSQTWADEDKAQSGVVVSIAHDGSLEVAYGVVKPEVWEAMQRETRKVQSPTLASVGGEVVETQGYSAAVTEDLTKFRTAALAVSVASHPQLGLRLVAYSLASSLFTSRWSVQHVCQITVKRTNITPEQIDAENTGPMKRMEEGFAKWAAVLPKQPKALWYHIHETMTEAQVIELMAFCAALSVDAVVSRSLTIERAEVELLADQAARFGDYDVARDWTPSQTFFKRVPKAVAVAAVKAKGLEVGLVQAITAAKKAEASEIAAAALKGTGWIASPLEAVVPSFRDDGETDADEMASDDDVPFDIAA